MDKEIQQGCNIVKLPRFLEGEELPKGYYDPPDPYSSPDTGKYNLGAMVRYAQSHGKQVTDLTKEEVKEFINY